MIQMLGANNGNIVGANFLNTLYITLTFDGEAVVDVVNEPFESRVFVNEGSEIRSRVLSQWFRDIDSGSGQAREEYESCDGK